MAQAVVATLAETMHLHGAHAGVLRKACAGVVEVRAGVVGGGGRGGVCEVCGVGVLAPPPPHLTVLCAAVPRNVPCP